MANEPLRGCPTCGTRVSKVKMGLRDYRWVSGALPGRVAPMDLDCLIECGGNFLCLEFKPKGQSLPLGQRLTLKALVRQGWDVWVVWEEDDHHVEVGAMDKRGDIPFVEALLTEELSDRVSTWWRETKDAG